jgi:carboxyl-terminal processing protease
MNRPKYYIYLPLFFALAVLIGVFIGKVSFTRVPAFASSNASSGKIENILRYIDEQYVDTIKPEELVDKTIVSMLQNLDPHSAYITADELQSMNEPLQGNFEGIGVEFNIVDDTIRVINAISGGPAEAVGVLAGDRIVKVDGVPVAGVKITNKDVMTKLKGPGGTKVKVSVYRRGKKQLLDFTITRGTIPIYSIDVAYMVAPQTGYIKITRFAATTYEEYLEAFAKLREQGMEKLIVDVRGNGGGYLNTAVDIADEFLPAGKNILYTEGKARPRHDYDATAKGQFETGEIVILIDDGSASASEILAGALQDNDRATIIGRRSFGKGLVQEQTDFSDGSALRLTIARYFTPTGRSIQKPYTNDVHAYYDEEYSRYSSGELESADSIKTFDSLKFTTPGGRIVYGGGGIIPDVFVPLDTTGRSRYLTEVAYNGLINDYAFEYADRERSKLQAFKTAENFRKQFQVDDKLIAGFVAYAEKNKVLRNDREIKVSDRLIRSQLKALIARNIWNNEGFYPVLLESDNVLRKAIEILQKKK